VYKGFNSRAEALSYIAGYARMTQQLTGSPTPALNSTPMSPPLNSRPRIYSMSDDDEIVIEEPMDTGYPSFLNDQPTQVVYANSWKRPSPNTMAPSNKRGKPMLNDIEIIDLTDSPPKAQSRRTPYSTDGLYPSLSSPSLPNPSPFPQHVGSNGSRSSRPNAQSTYRSPHQFQAAQVQRYEVIRSEAVPRPSSLFDDDDITILEVDANPKPVPSISNADCSIEQRRILALVSQGKNVFFTGSAGVGKSFVLQKICTMFKSQGLQQFSDFFITASTG
jgi:hypothetical protein